MIKVVIIGAGGHGREVAQILIEQYKNSEEIEILGFIDENQALHNTKINGLRVLGGMRWLEVNNDQRYRAICAVGNPRVMKILTDKIKQLGIEFTNAIHPTANIASDVELGQGVIIFPNTSVSVNVKLGNFITINVNSSISHDTIIEDYVNINPKVAIAGNVSIGHSTFVGMGSSVIQGLKIGSYSIIGAGSVVVRNIPSNSLAFGVPARVIKSI